MSTNTLKLDELKYIDFSSNKKLFNFFNDEKEFQNMFDKKIKLLSNKSSMIVWLHIFGQEVQAHTQWFAENHWMNHAKKECIEINWLEHYNNQTKKPIEEALKKNFSYKLENKVFFFNAPLEMMETTWDIFTKYWDDFFYYDDEAFIWCFDEAEVLKISPLGHIVKFKVP